LAERQEPSYNSRRVFLELVEGRLPQRNRLDPAIDSGTAKPRRHKPGCSLFGSAAQRHGSVRKKSETDKESFIQEAFL
jgi:hypothetical protein